jgi:hypothetical protein
MRPANYSYQTARFVLPVLVLVGGGAALGQFIQPGVGAAVGAGAGGLVLLFLLARATWIARRGDAWVTAGRALGLKSIYSGHIPVLPFPGLDEPANFLGASAGRFQWFVGDRTERLLMQEHESGWNSDDEPVFHVDEREERLTNPLPVETFFLVRMPGVAFPAVSAGKSRGLLGRGDEDRLPELGLKPLADWLRRHPGWRLEAAGEFVLASRPRIIVRPSGLAARKHPAEDLMTRLEQLTFRV